MRYAIATVLVVGFSSAVFADDAEVQNAVQAMVGVKNFVPISMIYERTDSAWYSFFDFLVMQGLATKRVYQDSSDAQARRNYMDVDTACQRENLRKTGYNIDPKVFAKYGLECTGFAMVTNPAFGQVDQRFIGWDRFKTEFSPSDTAKSFWTPPPSGITGYLDLGAVSEVHIEEIGPSKQAGCDYVAKVRSWYDNPSIIGSALMTWTGRDHTIQDNCYAVARGGLKLVYVDPSTDGAQGD